MGAEGGIPAAAADLASGAMPMPRRDWRGWRLVGALAALTAVLYGAARLGLAFATVHGNASPVWPPTGLALAALLVFGPRLWPAVALASFLVVAWTPAGPLAAVAIGMGNAAEALVGAWLLRHVSGFDVRMQRLRDVATLALFGAALAPAASTVVGVLSLCAAGAAPWSAAPAVALTWYTGNALGALLVTPVVLAWASPSPPSPASRLETSLAATGLALTCGLTFFRPESLAVADAAFAFGTFPFLAWIGLRSSRRVSATLVLMVGVAAVAGTALGRGPFHADNDVVSALLVQVFQAVATLAVLLLSAVVAQQRHAELARRESEDLLRQLATQSDQVFWVTQTNPERVLMVSPAFEVTWGRSCESLLADPSTWLRALHDEDRERVAASFAAWLANPTQGAWRADFRVVRPDGEIRWIADSGVKLPDVPGRPRRMAGIARDVTPEVEARAERDRVERQLQEGRRLEGLGLLAGGVAHDFNNVLSVVLGAAQLASREVPDEAPARSHLARIEQAARHAASICRQLLASAGQDSVQPRPVDVSALAGEAMPLLRASLPPAAVLDAELARDLPPVVADPAQLRQVLINLVMNAGEALRDGRGRVVVRTHLMNPDARCRAEARPAGLGPGPHVCMQVEDDGQGMEPEVVQRIFDPFFSTKFVGRGLGLAAVLGVARAHGGAVLVESEPGRGSRFCLLLRPAEVVPEPVAPESLDATWPRALRVLVVDDDADVRAILLGLLGTLRARVTLAESAEAGLAAFRAAPSSFDLVLLDLSMPGMTGDEVLRAMRSLRPDARVVLMSGYSEAEVRERLPGLEPAGFLQKPFGIEELRERLAAMLRP